MIDEMTLDEPDLDVDTSSIFQLPSPPDWAYSTQIQLVPIHGAFCVYDEKWVQKRLTNVKVRKI